MKSTKSKSSSGQKAVRFAADTSTNTEQVHVLTMQQYVHWQSLYTFEKAAIKVFQSKRALKAAEKDFAALKKRYPAFKCALDDTE